MAISFLCLSSIIQFLSQKVDSEKLRAYKEKCELLLKEPEIRFAGIINSMGNLIAGGFKEGISPLEDEPERRKMYMELVLRVSTRKEFDYSLGPVKYSASRREKVVMMSFPLKNEVLLTVAEPNVNIDRQAYKIIKMLEKEWFSFYGN
jgi:hypothetical protein